VGKGVVVGTVVGTAGIVGSTVVGKGIGRTTGSFVVGTGVSIIGKSIAGAGSTKVLSTIGSILVVVVSIVGCTKVSFHVKSSGC
jgi:hypothetical protein